MNNYKLSIAKQLFLYALAVIATLISATSARAELIFVGTTYDADTNISQGYAYDTSDQKIYWWYANHNNGDADMVLWKGDPNPEGDGNSGFVDKHAFQQALEDLKKIGGTTEMAPDPWKSPIGLDMLSKGKGPVPIIDPYDGNALTQDAFGGGGGGGFDPNAGPIGEQISKQKGKGKGKDDDGEGNHNENPQNHGIWDGYPADPELVNPIPIELPADVMEELIFGAYNHQAVGNVLAKQYAPLPTTLYSTATGNGPRQLPQVEQLSSKLLNHWSQVAQTGVTTNGSLLPQGARIPLTGINRGVMSMPQTGLVPNGGVATSVFQRPAGANGATWLPKFQKIGGANQSMIHSKAYGALTGSQSIRFQPSAAKAVMRNMSVPRLK